MFKRVLWEAEAKSIKVMPQSEREAVRRSLAAPGAVSGQAGVQAEHIARAAVVRLGGRGA
jgi:hypothetical protein